MSRSMNIAFTAGTLTACNLCSWLRSTETNLLSVLTFPSDTQCAMRLQRRSEALSSALPHLQAVPFRTATVGQAEVWNTGVARLPSRFHPRSRGAPPFPGSATRRIKSLRARATIPILRERAARLKRR